MKQNGMVIQMNKIIANQLLKRYVVFLPTIGTIRVESRSAKLSKGSEVVPPLNIVEFSSEQSGESLVDTVQRLASTDVEKAQDIYDRWLAKVTAEGELRVEGVGVLRDKSFVCDKAFYDRLNPQGAKPVKVTRKGGDKFIWAILLLSVAVSSYFIVPFIKDAIFNKPNVVAKREITENVKPSAVVVDTHEDIQVIAEPTPAPKRSGILECEKLTSKRYYVILGVFSTEANAVKAIREAKLTQGGGVYYFGSKFMASAFESDDAAEAKRYKSENRGAFSELWIYQAK